MFASIESFTLFFSISIAVIILLIVFEDKLTAIEKRYDAKKKQKRGKAK